MARGRTHTNRRSPPPREHWLTSSDRQVPPPCDDGFTRAGRTAARETTRLRPRLPSGRPFFDPTPAPGSRFPVLPAPPPPSISREPAILPPPGPAHIGFLPLPPPHARTRTAQPVADTQQTIAGKTGLYSCCHLNAPIFEDLPPQHIKLDVPQPLPSPPLPSPSRPSPPRPPPPPSPSLPPSHSLPLPSPYS
ncbi:hypothetical protein FKM82_028779 [Ascaphus truei]